MIIRSGSIRPDVRDQLDRLVTLDSAIELHQAGRSILAQVSNPAELDWLLRELKNVSERYLGVDPYRSIRISEILIDLAGSADRTEHQAFGWLAKADALRALARYDESRALFIAAGQSFLAQNNQVGWARTRTGLLLVSPFLGRSAEALAEVDRAKAILIDHGEWLRAAGLNQNAGLAESELGRYDEALARFGEALAMYERAVEAGQLGAAAAEVRSAKTWGNQALVLTRRGDFRLALTLLEAARATFARHGETVQVHSQDTFIGDVHVALGNYSQALRLYGQAFVGFGAADLAVDAAVVALKRVECYLQLNLNAVALELSQDAVARFEAVHSPPELAKAQVYRALALARLGQPRAALILLDLAVKTFEETGAVGHLGLTLLQRADIRLAEEDWPAAEGDAQRARSILLDRGMLVPAARAGLTLAAGWLRNAHLELAESQLADSLVIAQDRDLAWLARGAHQLRGRLARARADDRTALAEYRASIASIERVQGGLANELQINYLGDKLGAYHEAIELCLIQGQVADAFDFLERAKSRALVDYLARHPDVRFRPDGLANQLVGERLARLREEHHWSYHRLHGDRLDAADPTTVPAARSADMVALQRRIRDLEKDIGDILEQQALERGHPNAATRQASIEGSGRSFPPALPTGTVLLEYYCAGDRFGVFVWADARLTFVPLSAQPDELRRLLNAWSLNLTATARAIAVGASLSALAKNAEKILRGLGRVLLREITGTLEQCERLIVIPHGLTHVVPFGALLFGQGPLIESLDLSVCPSTSVLRLAAAHRVRDRTRALVIGHSDGGRLPGAVAEAEMIASIVPGACYLDGEATRVACVREAPRFGVIHLAAHGESRLDNPIFAHLKLADGLLSPVDVFNLDLDGALVTLSGCETGQSIVAGGDELVGLSRGFLYAGASTLVQSLWRVEDRSTARLMETFYRALSSGCPAGSALREAQRILRAEHGEHPFFWAPFQVVGDPGYLASRPADE